MFFKVLAIDSRIHLWFSGVWLVRSNLLKIKKNFASRHTTPPEFINTLTKLLLQWSNNAKSKQYELFLAICKIGRYNLTVLNWVLFPWVERRPTVCVSSTLIWEQLNEFYLVFSEHKYNSLSRRDYMFIAPCCNAGCDHDVVVYLYSDVSYKHTTSKRLACEGVVYGFSLISYNDNISIVLFCNQQILIANEGQSQQVTHRLGVKTVQMHLQQQTIFAKCERLL